MASSVASTPRPAKTKVSQMKSDSAAQIKVNQSIAEDIDDGLEQQIENDIPDLPFLRPDHFTDVTLLVGGKKLYSSRALLAYNSPVLAKILGAASSKTKELNLPEKEYEDVVELLAYIDPRVDYIITEQSAIALLPLAHEYEVAGLKQLCEETITAAFRSISKSRKSDSRVPVEISLEYLHLADSYTFLPLRELCITELVLNDDRYTTQALMASEMIMEPSKIDILDRKVDFVKTELDKTRRERTSMETKLGDYGNKRIGRHPLRD